MPILQVRELPEVIYQKLVRQAKKEHRSLSQQAITELSKALDLSLSNKQRRKNILDKIHEWQKSQALKTLADPIKMIREDRNR